MKEKLKTIGYLLFAWNYWLCTLMCKRKEEKVFGIMTHDSSKESNVGMVLEELSREEDYEIIRLKRGDEKKLSFYFGKSYHLATASCVLQDNVFLPMAYLRFPKEVKVIQLWHGTGTIKKFGQDYNTGRLKKLEARADTDLYPYRSASICARVRWKPLDTTSTSSLSTTIPCSSSSSLE